MRIYTLIVTAALGIAASMQTLASSGMRAERADAPSTSPAPRYADKKLGFSFEPPPGWMKIPNSSSLIVIHFAENRQGAKDVVAENANVTAVKMPPGQAKVRFDKELVAAVKATVEQQTPGVKFIDEGPAKIGGLDGYRLISTFTVNGIDLKIKQVLVGHGSHMFTVTCCSSPADYDRYLPMFDTLIESFRFDEPK